MTHSHRALVPGLAALTLLACGGDHGPGGPSRPGGNISSAEIVARAATWWEQRWDPDLAYDPAAAHLEPDGTSYRRDAAGFVSMAWHLDHSRLTADADALAAVAMRIPRDELRAGDLIVAAGTGAEGHAILFESWVDAERTAYWAYELAGTPLQHRTVKTSGDDLVTGDGRTFEAYRYKQAVPEGSGSGGGSGQQTIGDAPPQTGFGYRPCELGLDGRLYCAIRPGVMLRASPSAASAVVNCLRTMWTWFDCWTTTGSTVWFRTRGDDHSGWGWLAISDVFSENAANPGALGLRSCAAPPPPPPVTSCSVHSDGKLWCDNTGGAPLRASAASRASVVNHLRTTHSWFDCWGTGDLHAGGNTTWYHTLGDDNGNLGWVAAVYLKTSSPFDANPSARGLRQCTASRPPPGNGCAIRSDRKLWCSNSPGAAIRSSASTGAFTVDALRTTYSWFSCWATGSAHAGGNSTWYFTQGDDHGRWGWVAAVDMGTSSAFDANPAAGGLARCPP